MTRRHRGYRIGGLALSALLAGCGLLGRPGAPDPDKPLRLRFEERAEPEVFSLAAVAVRDGPKGSPGLWAAVRGLKRPERARVVNPRTGAEVEVALYSAPAGAPEIQLSNDAADALRIVDPTPVEITALRNMPEIDTTEGRF